MPTVADYLRKKYFSGKKKEEVKQEPQKEEKTNRRSYKSSENTNQRTAAPQQENWNNRTSSVQQQATNQQQEQQTTSSNETPPPSSTPPPKKSNPPPKQSPIDITKPPISALKEMYKRAQKSGAALPTDINLHYVPAPPGHAPTVRDKIRNWITPRSPLIRAALKIDESGRKYAINNKGNIDYDLYNKQQQLKKNKKW